MSDSRVSTEPSDEAGSTASADRTRTIARLARTVTQVDRGHAPEGSDDEPSRIGRYCVIRLLGAGAMGRVLLAHDDLLDRDVAIKVIRRGLSVEAEARLAREARGLARLSHPNVVEVYEVGRTEWGPHVVMEYVDGRDLRRWLSEGHAWPEVLRVFEQAGRGLAAAHAAGLVHRDFKPANVLVGADRRTRVADFGLVMEPRSPGSAEVATVPDDSVDGDPLDVMMTETGLVMGTPAYMAPEQARGAWIDARCDQYAFCVSLFEGLYGCRPFRARTHAELFFAKETGRIEPRPEGHEIPTWLDQAVVRGLATRPDERHPSMNALLDALTAPAAPRRRWVLLGATAGLGLAALLGSTLVGGDPCSREASGWRGAWSDEARDQLARAFAASGPTGQERWRSFEAGMSEYLEDWTDAYRQTCREAPDDSVSAEDRATAFGARMQCLASRRAEARAMLDLLRRGPRSTLDRAAHALAQLDPPARCRAVAADPPVGAGSSHRVLEQLARARAHELTGDARTGLAVARRALDAARTQGDDRTADRARYRVGSLLYALGEHTPAEEHLEAAYWGASATGDIATAFDAATKLIMVTTHGGGRLADGLTWVRHARALLSRHEVSPEDAGTLELNHASALRKSGEHAQALEHLGRARELYAEVMDADDPRWGLLENAEGITLDVMGRFDEAQRHYHRVIELRIRHEGEGHPHVAAARVNLGSSLLEQGHYDEAEALFDQVLAQYLERHGPEHEVVAMCLHNLGVVAYHRGRHDQARRSFEQALRIRRARLGEDHPLALSTLNNLGAVVYLEGDIEAAVRFLQQTLLQYESLYGPEHLEVAEALANLGALLLEEGQQVERGRRMLERAVAIRERAGVEDLPLATALSNLAMVELGRARPDEAIALQTRAIRIIEAQTGPDHPRLIEVLHGLGESYRVMQRWDEAIPTLERALELASTRPGADDAGRIRVTLAEALGGAADHERGREILAPMLSDPTLPATVRAHAHFVAAQLAGDEQPGQAARAHQQALALLGDATDFNAQQLRRRIERWRSEHPAIFDPG